MRLLTTLNKYTMQTSLKDINRVFPKTKKVATHLIVSLLLTCIAAKYIDSELAGFFAYYCFICFLLLIVRHVVIYVRLRAMYDENQSNDNKGGK